MADRIPCINPSCRRTAPAAKYEPGTEIICRTCFRSLPEELRAGHSDIHRAIRKWERRILKTSDELEIARMKGIIEKLANIGNQNWQSIKDRLYASETPAGIENFIKEIGLG